MEKPEEFQLCAERLRALADPDRLRIVQCLFDGPLTVGHIADRLESEIVKISHHLAILRRANIVRSEKHGRFVEYSIHPDVKLEELRKEGETRQINFGCCRVDLKP